jgi:hypothetical protein
MKDVKNVKISLRRAPFGVHMSRKEMEAKVMAFDTLLVWIMQKEQ